jgi:hypothetical protein
MTWLLFLPIPVSSLRSWDVVRLVTFSEVKGISSILFCLPKYRGTAFLLTFSHK